MAVMMIERGARPRSIHARRLGDRIADDVAAGHAGDADDRVDGFVGEARRVEAGAADASDALLLAHREHPAVVGNRRAGMARDATQPERQRCAPRAAHAHSSDVMASDAACDRARRTTAPAKSRHA